VKNNDDSFLCIYYYIIVGDGPSYNSYEGKEIVKGMRWASVCPVV
jgi:hypothetical protein